MSTTEQQAEPVRTTQIPEVLGQNTELVPVRRTIRQADGTIKITHGLDLSEDQWKKLGGKWSQFDSIYASSGD